MSSAMGRPKTNQPKNVQLKIRADNETVQKLNYCCDKTGLNKSEVIRLGIEKVHQSVDNQN